MCRESFTVFICLAVVQGNSAGILLCHGLFSPDYLSQWLSSVALSHALVSNTNNKELSLRVRLANAVNADAVSLLHLVFNILQQVVTSWIQNLPCLSDVYSYLIFYFFFKGGKLQTRLGVLTLLSTWLSDCPNAVAQFLKLPNAVAFLTALVWRIGQCFFLVAKR